MKDNFQDSVEDNLNALVAVGTLMNQLGRLDPDDLLQKDAVETVRTALNKLFKDYIEAKQPELVKQAIAETTVARAQALQQYKSNLLEGLR